MLRQFEIQNFKSIAGSTVNLGRFNVLVGPNGSGKSNFVEALKFVADCLKSRSGITPVVREHGGARAISRYAPRRPRNIRFALSVELDQQRQAEYSFELTATAAEGSYIVKNESCRISAFFGEEHAFEVESGRFVQPIPGIRPQITSEHLTLPLVSAVEEFRPLFNFLSGMRFYSLSPDRIREPQDLDPGESLERDGSNCAAVLRSLKKHDVRKYERVCRLLGKIVPGLESVRDKQLEQKDTMEFVQGVAGEEPWVFPARNMSDGTLRVLGVLLAIYQVPSPMLIAMEEPEATIHPAATEILVDVLKDGANFSQIVITTHSPDILDHKSITDDEIFVVEAVGGMSRIGHMDAGSRDAVRDRLYSAGELLRMGELHPDRTAQQATEDQLRLLDQ